MTPDDALHQWNTISLDMTLTVFHLITQTTVVKNEQPYQEPALKRPTTV